MTSEYKRLYRSRKQRMLFGVCGGLGEYFKIDPTLVRLIFVITALMGGPGLLAYIILWIVVPEEPIEAVDTITVEAKPAPETQDNNQ